MSQTQKTNWGQFIPLVTVFFFWKNKTDQIKILFIDNLKNDNIRSKIELKMFLKNKKEQLKSKIDELWRNWN